VGESHCWLRTSTPTVLRSVKKGEVCRSKEEVTAEPRQTDNLPSDVGKFENAERGNESGRKGREKKKGNGSQQPHAQAFALITHTSRAYREQIMKKMKRDKEEREKGREKH
jgi:hypothetical protein